MLGKEKNKQNVKSSASSNNKVVNADELFAEDNFKSWVF